MKIARNLILILCAVLMVAVTAAFDVNPPPVDPANAPVSSVGMGDLRRYEGEAFVPGPAAQSGAISSVGIGDLRRYEGQSLIPVTGVQGSSQTAVGIGDLRRYEGTH